MYDASNRTSVSVTFLQNSDSLDYNYIGDIIIIIDTLLAWGLNKQTYD